MAVQPNQELKLGKQSIGSVNLSYHTRMSFTIQAKSVLGNRTSRLNVNSYLQVLAFLEILSILMDFSIS